MSTTSETGTTSPLEDGWQPTTPADDTYLRRFLLNWAGNCAAMARAHGGAVREGASVHMADSGRPVAFANCATLLQPLRAESAAAEMAAKTAIRTSELVTVLAS